MCKSQEAIIVMGDMNAKVGKGRHGNTEGEYGLGARNERGELFIKWCEANNQVITNTWFKQHVRRRWTWMSPGNRYKNQIDYICINQRFRNSIRCSKSLPGADCDSDHIPVFCDLRIKLKRLKKAELVTKFDFDLLLKDSLLRETYNIEVRNKYEILQATDDTKPWDNYRDALVESADKLLPLKSAKPKTKWMTEEILEMMEDRRKKLKKGSDEYKEMSKRSRGNVL